MKEVLDIIVWIGFIYLLFVFLRGMNENQIKKHDEAIVKNEERRKAKEEKEKLEGTIKDD